VKGPTTDLGPWSTVVTAGYRNLVCPILSFLFSSKPGHLIESSHMLQLSASHPLSSPATNSTISPPGAPILFLRSTEGPTGKTVVVRVIDAAASQAHLRTPAVQCLSYLPIFLDYSWLDRRPDVSGYLHGCTAISLLYLQQLHLEGHM
jgi:hypothetical protein